MSTVNVGAPQPNPGPPPVGLIINTVLSDLFVAGVAAASIFVKNPAHQQQAASIINILQQLLPTIEKQIYPGAGTGQ